MTTNLRINVILGPFLSVPPAPAGAVERIWWAVTQEFMRQGVDVQLVVRKHLALEGGLVGSPWLTVVPGATFRSSLSRNLMSDAFYAARVLRVLRDADVTVTNTTFLPLFMGLLRRRSWGKIVVSVARMPKRQMRLYRLLGADRFAAVSSATRDAIVAEDPLSADLTRVFPNPIDTETFCVGPSESSPGTPATATILYAGRIHPEKGLDILVRAFVLLASEQPQVRLRLIGPAEISLGGGGMEYVRRLQDLAADSPLSIEPAIYDRRALRDVMRSATVFCYPSVAERGETFGVAPLEAIACGTPTIVSQLSCFGDFATPEKTVLTFDHRADAAHLELSRALRRLITDASLRDRLAHAGAVVAQEFSAEAIAKRYLRDFEELCSQEKHTSRSKGGPRRGH